MALFINQQRAPYVTLAHGGDEGYGPYHHTMTYQGPVPHGRSDDFTWGPNEFGYTDFDDYHLNIYGA